MGNELSEKITWKQKYLISLKEQLTIVDIKKLRGASTSAALQIRKNAIDHMKKSFKGENFIEPKIKVDTDAVFAVTGHNQEYYLKKMMDERKALS